MPFWVSSGCVGAFLMRPPPMRVLTAQRRSTVRSLRVMFASCCLFLATVCDNVVVGRVQLSPDAIAERLSADKAVAAASRGSASSIAQASDGNSTSRRRSRKKSAFPSNRALNRRGNPQADTAPLAPSAQNCADLPLAVIAGGEAPPGQLEKPVCAAGSDPPSAAVDAAVSPRAVRGPLLSRLSIRALTHSVDYNVRWQVHPRVASCPQ